MRAVPARGRKAAGAELATALSGTALRDQASSTFLKVFLSYVFIIAFRIPPWAASPSCLCHSSAVYRVMNESTLFPSARPRDLSLVSQ